MIRARAFTRRCCARTAPRGTPGPATTLLLALLILGTASVAFAQSELLWFADSIGVVVEWDPYRRVAVLHNHYDRVEFNVAAGTAVLNYTEIVAREAVAIEGGVLTVSEEAEARVRALFASSAPTDGAYVSAIVIDPGHGGRDPGATRTHTIDGEDVLLNEKDIVLGVSMELRELLVTRYPDRTHVITRDEDVFLQLEERVEIANAVEIDPAKEIMVFVSVHANASLNSRTYGYEVWYLPPEYGRTGLVESSEVGDQNSNVLSLLNLIRDDEYTNESIRLAQSILDGFDAAVGSASRNLGLKEESWFVVRNAKMPSILVELGFLTNPEEAARLTDPEYLRSLTMGLYNGITGYIDDFERRYRDID